MPLLHRIKEIAKPIARVVQTCAVYLAMKINQPHPLHAHLTPRRGHRSTHGNMFRLRVSSWLFRPKTLLRFRAMSSNADLLINDPKYSWLKDLGIEADNPGVFDGTWHANGPVRNDTFSMKIVVQVLEEVMYKPYLIFNIVV